MFKASNQLQVCALATIRICLSTLACLNLAQEKQEPLQDFLAHSSVNTNDTLRLASMWHGLCQIAAESAPVTGCTGIELLQADTFNLHCFQTLTDTKFLLMTDPTTPDNEVLLRETIYDLYCDYVLKNPFYEPEMPIRCDLFDQKLIQHISYLHKRWGLSSQA